VQQQAVLIVAQSGRFLAQLAHRAGYSVWVADCFGDQDTLAVSDRWLALTDLSDHAAVTQTLIELSQNDPCFLVYGSGIEAFYPTLRSLPKTMTLVGNTADIIEQVKTPHRFFALLQQLAIPYPETHFVADNNRTGRWLCKPFKGFGGQLILDYDKQNNAKDTYLQQHIEGISGSALFLADGRSAEIYSLNQQFSLSQKETPFLQSGLSRPLAASKSVYDKINQFINQLVSHTGLLGFNSLDFIITSDEEILILEINPRLSASAQLIDSSTSLFDCHLAACTASLMKGYSAPLKQRHLHTIFAPFDVVIPDVTDWPDYCHDLPRAKTLIRQNTPICTVVIETALPFKQSESESRQSVLSLLNLLENDT
jgi:predicted ATP-grasp superfamily ATP-dependent carboligase